MSEVQTKKPAPKLLQGALWGVAVIGVAAVLYVIGASSIKPKTDLDISDLREGALAKLVVPKVAREAPTDTFADEAGKPVHVADFAGNVVVMNLWATWCAPCKKEMPTLAKLAAAYQAQPVKVLAVSVDKDDDLDLARADMAANPPLKLYRDPGYKLAFGLIPKAQGFPTTVIFDRHGLERARLSGDADWNSPQARELIERLLREK